MTARGGPPRGPAPRRGARFPLRVAAGLAVAAVLSGTPWIAVNFNFERRIAMFPAGFDAEGLMYANTRFGDFPHQLPNRRWQDRNELFTGWMLLSYRKACSASSVRSPYSAANVTDEHNFWPGVTDVCAS